MSSSIRKAEIEKFSKDAGDWWDENGPFAPLHRLNPARMGYIRRQICGHFGLGQTDLKPFKGLSILDVGCGGGLVCEPLARLGARVTGIDADAVAIGVAREHAKSSRLAIDYRNKAAEELTTKFDAVLALEIIEHVENPAQFVRTIAKCVKPGGLAVFSTLNRTPKSFALGIVAAEYILKIVPRGTHSWKNFVKPSEMAKHLRHADLHPENISGLALDPFTGEFNITEKDIAVNYFISAKKL